MRILRRMRDVVVHRILGVDDTPHRIAWGVFLGFIVGWTPTLGFQIMIYVAVATVLRANKVSGIPIVFISNPFTAVPLYYFAWWLGVVLLHGHMPDAATGATITERIGEPTAGGDVSIWTDILTESFWRELGATLWQMGAELWVGCLVLGVLTGVPGYMLAYWGVKAYRRRRLPL